MFSIHCPELRAISFGGPGALSAHLGLTPRQFGFAGGIFLASYILLEAPSKLVLHRVAARRRLPRMIVSWGLLVLHFAWVDSDWELYALRFLLAGGRSRLLPRGDHLPYRLGAGRRGAGGL